MTGRNAIRMIGRGLGHLVFGAIALGAAAVGWLAFGIHLDGPARWIAVGAGGVALLLALGLRLRARYWAWAFLALILLAFCGWFATLRPMADRDWAADVARGVTAQVEGDVVTLSDIRDFDWITRDDAVPAWVSRRYDLTRLETVEMVTSVWDSPDIAHLLVSFGFATPQGPDHVVFSVEIRREADESFNEIGGFLRQFEMVLVAATEEDIIRLRTDFRHETVRMYEVQLTPEQRREMFMSYVALAQDLERAPRFYNTLLANCTTVVYRLAQVLDPDLPLDWRLVLSGHLPDYLGALGVVEGEGSARDAAALISGRTDGVAREDYSAAIRQRP